MEVQAASWLAGADLTARNGRHLKAAFCRASGLIDRVRAAIVERGVRALANGICSQALIATDIHQVGLRQRGLNPHVVPHWSARRKVESPRGIGARRPLARRAGSLPPAGKRQRFMGF
jgi:hypothetical protein